MCLDNTAAHDQLNLLVIDLNVEKLFSHHSKTVHLNISGCNGHG